MRVRCVHGGSHGQPLIALHWQHRSHHCHHHRCLSVEGSLGSLPSPGPGPALEMSKCNRERGEGAAGAGFPTPCCIKAFASPPCPPPARLRILQSATSVPSLPHFCLPETDSSCTSGVTSLPLAGSFASPLYGTVYFSLDYSVTSLKAYCGIPRGQYSTSHSDGNQLVFIKQMNGSGTSASRICQSRGDCVP